MKDETTDQLNQMIDAIQDECVLNLLIDEIIYYGKKNIIDELNTNQLSEFTDIIMDNNSNIQ